MATEALATRADRSGFETRLVEAGFVITMLLVIVGLTPFDTRTAAALAARDAASASGDTLRQVVYLATFGMILYGALAVRAIPLSIVILLAWCAATALWAAEPDVVMRRAVLATIFVFSMLLVVDTLGSARTVALLRYVMAAIIVADLLSVALVHNAIHQADDLEAGLAGAWRGLHSHKNMAGSVAASAVVMFFYFWREGRKRSDLLLCLASFVFLVMTRSKSSLGLLPVALAAGALYRVAARNRLDRTIAAVASALFVLGFGLAVT